jgi:CIC family chloride channel protein
MSNGPPDNGPLTVGELMRRRFITASPRDRLADVRQTMRLARLRHLVVAEDGYLVGILTYRDLLETTLERRGNAPDEPQGAVAGAMVSDPECVSTERSLAEVAARFWQSGLGCLPVVAPSNEGRRLVGLVTESDLLRAAYDPFFRSA